MLGKLHAGCGVWRRYEGKHFLCACLIASVCTSVLQLLAALVYRTAAPTALELLCRRISFTEFHLGPFWLRSRSLILGSIS